MFLTSPYIDQAFTLIDRHDECNRDFATTIRGFCARLTIFLLRISASSTTMKAKKSTLKKVQAIRCPTCGAGPGEKCKLNTGQPRTTPHRDRRLIAAD
jgi:hypothetical protein